MVAEWKAGMLINFPNGLELPVMTFWTLVGCLAGWDAAISCVSTGAGDSFLFADWVCSEKDCFHDRVVIGCV